MDRPSTSRRASLDDDALAGVPPLGDREDAGRTDEQVLDHAALPAERHVVDDLPALVAHPLEPRPHGAAALAADRREVDRVPVVPAQPRLQRRLVDGVEGTDAGGRQAHGELGDVGAQVRLRGAAQPGLVLGVVDDDLAGLEVDRADPGTALLRDVETVGAVAPPPPHCQDIFHVCIIGTCGPRLHTCRPSGRHPSGVSCSARRGDTPDE